MHVQATARRVISARILFINGGVLSLLVSSVPTAMSAEPVWDPVNGVWVGNKAADSVEVPDPLYVFGYGSLCWKTAL